MGKAKIELINEITRQFVAQITPGFLRSLNITSGYFNTERTLSIEDKALLNQDTSVINRILDGVNLDASTKQQFYAAVMQSNDQVHELLLPLIESIAKEIMTPERDHLKENIRKDFKKYNDVRKLFSDTGFYDVILRAIGSACLANLTDLQTKKTAALIATQAAADQLEARRLNTQFGNKISNPFDLYISSLNAERFKADLDRFMPIQPPAFQEGEAFNQNWFIAMVVRALVYLVSLFSGRSQAYQPAGQSEHIHELEMVDVESPIEVKIQKVSMVVQHVLTTLSPLCEPQDPVLTTIQKFANHLRDLADRIVDSRSMEMDFEAGVTKDFNDFCEKLCDQLGPHMQILEQGNGATEQAAVQRVITELTRNLVGEKETNSNSSSNDNNDDENTDPQVRI